MEKSKQISKRHKWVFAITGLIVIIGVIALFSVAKNSTIAPSKSQKDQISKASTNKTLLEANPYTDNIKGFSINAPKGWTKGASRTGVLVSFVNPKYPGSTINILSEPSQDLSLQDYVDGSLVQLPKQIPGYTFTEKGAITLGGDPAYLVGGEFRQNDIKVKNRQVIVVKNGRAFIATATSSEDHWIPYQNEINASLRSLRVQ